MATIWHVVGLVLSAIAVAGAVEIPAKAFSDLGSRQFHQREAAQRDLLGWGRTQPNAAMNELLQQSRNAGDPEVRERCLVILRELVMDEYMRGGKGYIGIGLRDDVAAIPGDPKPKNLIRVLQVKQNTPGQLAGICAGDLIVETNGKVWNEALFREKIGMMKPNTKVELKVLRGGELIELTVNLTRRPLDADIQFFDGRNIDPEASERAAREAYFRQWLSERKPQK